MEAVQIHTRAENGRITIDLPAEHAALANAQLLVLLVAEPELATQPTDTLPQFPATDWDAVQRAYEAFEGHDPYPTITDPVAWQREIRGEWDRDLTPAQP